MFSKDDLFNFIFFLKDALIFAVEKIEEQDNWAKLRVTYEIEVKEI
jgi:hypothetical protein